MADEWKQDLIHKEMSSIVKQLKDLWAASDPAYGPEIVYSIILNVIFQFCAGYRISTKGAVTAQQVIDQFVYDLQNLRPEYITHPTPMSEVVDSTSESL